jgi:hypothetical protein
MRNQRSGVGVIAYHNSIYAVFVENRKHVLIDRK